jgi:hypothetical protein
LLLKHSASKILEGADAAVGLQSMPLRLAKRHPRLPGQPKLEVTKLMCGSNRKSWITTERAGAAGEDGRAGRF